MTTVEALTMAIARVTTTNEHTQRVRTSAVNLAREVGVTDEAMIREITGAVASATISLKPVGGESGLWASASVVAEPPLPA